MIYLTYTMILHRMIPFDPFFPQNKQSLTWIFFFFTVRKDPLHMILNIIETQG